VDKGLAVVGTVVVGGLIALQAPINSLLGQRVGTFTAAVVSFTVGTVALVGIALAFGGGLGGLSEAKGLPWHYLVGGLLGAAYVTTVLLTVRELGAGGVTAATIAGQLTMSVVIDRVGVLGLEERPLSAGRLAGVVLLAAGTFLVVRE
jgi:bacterial/archaeal transporter family-2 protein